MGIEFVHEDGNKNDLNITVYALSTCGFCRRGLQFLRENKIAFRYIYVDHLDYDKKKQLKEELEKKFNERVRYPFLIINDTEVLLGFTPEEWKQKLL